MSIKTIAFSLGQSHPRWLVISSVLLAVASAQAEVVSWAGVSNPNFLNGINWSGGAAPGVSDDVIVDGAGGPNQAILSGSTSVGSLRVFAGTLTIGSGGELLSPSTTVDHFGSLVIQSEGAIFSNIQISVGGLVVVSGGVAGNVTVSDTGSVLELAGGDVTGRLELDGGTVHAIANTTLTGDQAGMLSGAGGVFSAAAGVTLALNNRVVAFEEDSLTGFGSAGETGIVAIDPGANLGATPESAQVNNAGTLNVQFGTLDFRSDGTHSGTFQIAEGARLQFTGSTHTLENSVTFEGSGEVLFSDSTIKHQGPGPFALARTTRLAGGTLELAAGAVVGSEATFAVVDGFGGTITGASGVFNNEGTFTVGIGSTPAVAIAFQNTGTVQVGAGGALTFTGGYTQTAGLLDLGGTLVHVASLGEPLAIEGGLLTGGGTITGDVAIGAATLRPSGTLTIEGDLTLAPETVWEVTATQTSAARLNEAGSSPLDLNNRNLLIDYQGVAANPGGELTILSSSQPLVGSFANLSPASRVIFEEGSFVVTTTGNQVTLSQFAPVLITEHIANYSWVGANGDWDARPNWDQASIPRTTISNVLFDDTFISQQTSVGIANGGTARKSGGTIRTTSLTIYDGRLILSDGADIQNFYFIDPPSGPPVRVDRPIFLGGTGSRGILQIGDGGTPGASIIHPNTEIHETTATGNLGGSVVFNHNASSYNFAPLIRHNISVLHEGPGTTALINTANIYSGGTTVTDGWIRLAGNSGLGHAVSGLHLNGGGIRYAAAFNDLRVFTLGTNGGKLDTNGFSPSYGHLIPSTGPFYKVGLGTLTLSGAQSISSQWSVQAGTLALTGGGTYAGGFQIAENTILQFGGGTHTMPTDVIIEGSGGFLLSGGILNGSGAITAQGPMTWTGGIISGAATDILNTFGGLTLSGGSMKTITARTLNHGDGTNPSLGNWTGGSLFLQAGSIFNNRASATFDTSFDGSVVVSGGAAFNNAGTFTKSGGTGTTTINAFFNNTGTVNIGSGTLLITGGGGTHSGLFNIAAGARLDLSSGTHLFTAGATITDTATSVLEKSNGGIATIERPLTLAGTLRASGGSLLLNATADLNRLDVLFNTFGGSGLINVHGPMTWSGGTISGPGAATSFLNAYGGFTLNGGGNKTLSARTFNHGDGVTPITGNWTGGALLLSSGAIFNNRAQALLATSHDGIIDGGTFNNTGTFTKSGGTGTTRVQAFFNNTGTVNIASGTLELHAGGTHSGVVNLGAGTRLNLRQGAYSITADSTIADTATSILEESDAGSTTVNRALTLAGLARVSGGMLVFNHAVDLNLLEVVSGTLTGPGTITANGQTIWTSGIISGGAADVLTARGGLTMSGGGTKQLTTRILNHGDGINPSTAIWSGGWFFMQGSSTFNNRANATFEVSFDHEIATSGASVFNNAGIFTKSGGTGATTVKTAFNNTGTVNANSGALVFSGPFTQTAGAFVLNGGTVTTTGGVLDIAGGLLGGTGTIIGGVTLRTGATLSPGHSAGLLSIVGNLVLNSGSQAIFELGGLGEGSGYDHVEASGTITLGGNLVVRVIDGFALESGAIFNLFDAASQSGSFASLDLPPLVAGLSWDTTELASTGLLRITGTADPLLAYLTDAGVPAEARGALDDPDGDGIPNLLEFALGLSPLVADSTRVPTAQAIGGLFTLTYDRAQPDHVTYEVETRTDLTGGSWSSDGVAQGTPGPDGFTTATVPFTDGARFLHLKVTYAPAP